MPSKMSNSGLWKLLKIKMSYATLKRVGRGRLYTTVKHQNFVSKFCEGGGVKGGQGQGQH